MTESTAHEGFPLLDTARLRLRQFVASDLPGFLAYRNDPEIARYQSWDTYSEAEGHAFLSQQLQTAPGTPGAWCQFALEHKATGRLLGDCALQVDAVEQRQGQIGFTLARENQGKGFATEAVARLLDYGFSELLLHRIIAITDSENTAAGSLLDRVGMRREGYFRQHVWFKGRWGSEYVYAMLEHEWQEGRAGK